MATKAEAETLAALAADSDAFDALRERAAGMVGRMMSEAERILEVGTPSDKAQFTKTVLPAILKQLQDKKEGDDLAELRAEQAALMADVRAALVGAGTVTPTDEPDLPADDTPPTPKPAKKPPARPPRTRPR